MKLKLNLIVLLLILSFVFVANNAFAQQVSGSATVDAKVAPIRTDAKIRIDAKMENNAGLRKDMQDIRASSTMMRKELNDERKEKMMDIRNSSSTRAEMKIQKTDLFKRIQGERKEIQKTSKADAFKTRKDALVKHLNITIENLLNIRGRINERIIKLEGEGKVMTEAKASLVIADGKLAAAKAAVDALASYTAPISNGAAVGSATAEVELSKPRQIGDDAIKAVKDARDALKVVLRLTVSASATI